MKSSPSLSRHLGWSLLLLVLLPVIRADQDLPGNVTVTGGASTGNLTVTGAIDSEGNTLTFGTQSSGFGAALLYQDSNIDTLTFNTNRNPASWLWQHNTSIPAMRLDSAHQLILYQADGTTAGLTFTPASSSLKLGSVATLTGDGSGAITTSGAFTVTGAFTNSNGSLTGGVNGLSLNAGGTNQNITLSSSGAGDIIFNTNSVERARITAAGNVGIGTASPGAKIHAINTIDGAANVVAAFDSLRTGSNVYLRLKNTAFTGGNDYMLYADSNGAFGVHQSGIGNLLTITQPGLVGIGTASPQAKLHVRSGGVRVQGDTSTVWNDASIYSVDTAPGGRSFAFGSRAGAFSITDETAAAYRLLVSSTGNVGIGTGSPDSGAKLHVAGGILTSASFDSTTGSTAGIDYYNGGLRLFGVGTSGANKGTFTWMAKGSDGSTSVPMYINGIGNVGIGTTSPGELLHLLGSNPSLLIEGNGITKAGLKIKTNDIVRWDINSPNASSDLRFNNGSSDIVTIRNSGNIGIGTTSPGAKLEVIGGYNPFGLIVEGDGVSANARIALRRANDSAATGNIDWIGNTNVVGARIGVNDDIIGSMAFKLGGSALADTRLLITSDGNVGIGTTEPIDKLQTEGTVAVSNNLGADSIFTAFSIRNSRPIDDYGGLYAQFANINLATLGPGTTGESYDHRVGDLRFSLKNSVGATTMSDVMTLRHNGNVGIGTISPGAKLEVIGGGNPFGLIVEGDGVNANARIALRRANAPGATGNIDWIGNTNAVGARIGVNDDIIGSMAFKLGGSALADTRLLITSDGNVGIGTTTPTHKLAVNGTIRAKEVIVDTGWADYVFDEDYRLAPLSEVESHIRTEKHLPGIPSAAEVAEHGVSMGDMQARLLSKVEELTLHLIAQEKELMTLKSQNNSLQKKVGILEASLR